MLKNIKFKILNRNIALLFFIAIFIVIMALFWKSDLNTIDFKNQEEIEDFFTYKNDNFFVISGHRGG